MRLKQRSDACADRLRMASECDVQGQITACAPAASDAPERETQSPALGQTTALGVRVRPPSARRHAPAPALLVLSRGGVPQVLLLLLLLLLLATPHSEPRTAQQCSCSILSGGGTV